jgi:hypothetical protein
MAARLRNGLIQRAISKRDEANHQRRLNDNIFTQHPTKVAQNGNGTCNILHSIQNASLQVIDCNGASLARQMLYTGQLEISASTKPQPELSIPAGLQAALDSKQHCISGL